MSTKTITIPNVELTIDQLVDAVRQLEPDARSKIVQALLTEDMDERFAQLLKRLENKSPATDVTDDEINKEVRAVRRQQR